MIRFTANCPCCDKHFRSSVEWKVDLAYNAHADECFPVRLVEVFV
jgi:hypothetical protein